METTKAFIFLLAFIIQFKNTLNKHVDLNPIHFEFSHREVLAISDSDEDVEDYYYDDPTAEESEKETAVHSRKRRSAQWAPNYDVYEQWADEYYSQKEENEGNVQSVVQQKDSLLDRLIFKTQQKTPEEIEMERKEDEQRREVLKSTIMYGSWTLGITLLFFFVAVMIKRCWRRFACDFCDPFTFKKKIEVKKNNLVPGVYVHKNGDTENYTPTKEEVDAIKDIQKILFSLA